MKTNLYQFEVQFFLLSEKTWKEEYKYSTRFWLNTDNTSEVIAEALTIAEWLAKDGLEFTSLNLWEILKNELYSKLYSEVAEISLSSIMLE